jgi:hypothetical protein
MHICQNKLKLYSSTDFTPYKVDIFKKNQIKTLKQNFYMEKTFFGIFVFDPF